MDLERLNSTPLMVMLRWMADAMGANLLFIACSMPVVTIGASVAGMYEVLTERQRTGTVAVIRTFFRGFLKSFGRGTALAGVVLALAALATGDLIFAGTVSGILRVVYAALGALACMLVLAVLTLGYAQEAAYKNGLVKILKNCLLLSIAMPGHALLSWLSWLVPWLLLVLFPDIFLVKLGVVYMLWGFSGPAALTVLLADRMFRKIEGKSGPQNNGRE